MPTKIYKKLFLRIAFKLFLAELSFNFMNFFTHLFFSKAKKSSKLLIYADKRLNKKICECHKLRTKCQYFEKRLKNSNKHLPV